MLRRQSFDGPWPGIIGGLVAVAAALIVRSIFQTRLLAELVVDASTFGLQPRGFSFFLGLFASAAKPLLFTTVLLGQLAVYLIVWRHVGLRLLPRTSFRRAAIAAAGVATVVFLALSVILVLVTPARLGSHTSWPGYVLATLFGSAVYAFIAGGYAAGVGEHREDLRPMDSRRAFVARLPALMLGGIALVVIARRLADTASGGVKAPSHFGRETPEITPNDQFYIISKNLLDPGIDASAWELRIGGNVGKTVRLSYNDIKAMPSVQQYATLQCISNEVGGDLMSTALWNGVRLHTVLDLAQPQSNVTHVLFRSEDDYTSSLPIDRARQEEVLLVYDMNGERLPEKHGYPLRLILPGKYGMRNPKWITEIMLLGEDREGYWERRGWSPQADMNTSSRIDIPSPGDNVGGDPLRIHGVAFGGNRGISRVEVSTDGGQSWNDATVKSPLSPYTWVLWYYDWRNPSGANQVSILARATDGMGQVQTAEEAPPYPSGATGYPRVPVFFKAQT